MKRALFVCLLLAAGCNEDPAADNGKGDHIPAPLPSSTGMEPAYPEGPYGLSPGDTVDDFDFQGFVNAHADKSTLQKIRLSDFYNPHGKDKSYKPADAESDDRLYPKGSQYGEGNKKPLALVIDIASVWCGPCNQEAKDLLPSLYKKYRPCGGEFLFQLSEGAAPGTEATQNNLAAWGTKYDVEYPSTFDPGRKLAALYSANSYPDGAIIDTTTMKVVTIINGVPDDAFWHTYESLLDASCLAGK